VLEWEEGSQSKAADAVKQRRASRGGSSSHTVRPKSGPPTKKTLLGVVGRASALSNRNRKPAYVVGSPSDGNNIQRLLLCTGAISVIQWSDGGRQTDRHLLLAHFRGISAADNHKGRKTQLLTRLPTFSSWFPSRRINLMQR